MKRILSTILVVAFVGVGALLVGPVNTSAAPLGCKSGKDYINLDGYQLRSKVTDISPAVHGVQHGELVCHEHVYRLERIRDGKNWGEWHTY